MAIVATFWSGGRRGGGFKIMFGETIADLPDADEVQPAMSEFLDLETANAYKLVGLNDSSTPPVRTQAWFKMVRENPIGAIVAEGTGQLVAGTENVVPGVLIDGSTRVELTPTTPVPVGHDIGTLYYNKNNGPAGVGSFDVFSVAQDGTVETADVGTYSYLVFQPE